MVFAGNQQNRKHHGGGDPHQEHADVAEQREESDHERLLGFGLGRPGRIAELGVDRLGDPRRMLRVVDQNVKSVHLAAAPFGQRLVDVLLVEEHDVAVGGSVENAAHREFEIAGENIALDRDAVAQVKVERVGQVAANHARRPLMDERLFLVLRNGPLGKQREQLFRLHGKAREIVARFPRVFVGSPKPGIDHRHPHAGDLFDLLLVGQRQKHRQRDAVAHHQPQRLVVLRFGQPERAVHGDHHAQQAHGNADAGDGEQRPPAVAPRVSQD